MDDPLYVCSSCGLVHTDRGTPEETAKAWEEWPVNYDPSWPAARARQVYVAEFLVQHGLTKGVFDVSVGDGFFIKECRRRGIPATGLVQGRSRPGCYTGTIENNEVEGRFPVVCINWTLENTADPVAMLRWARAYGDHVVVATSSRILVPFKKPLWAYIDRSPVHLHPQFFSFETLRSTMGHAGLAVGINNRYIDSDYLVVVGVDGEGWWSGDHPDKVIEFFNRWHEDTKCYARD